MITQDFINGYIAALENVKAFLNSEIQSNYTTERKAGFQNTITFIESVKDNYKQLIKTLNEENK